MKNYVMYIGPMEFPFKNAAAQRVLTNAKILREIGYELILVGLNKELTTNSKKTLEGFTVYERPYPKSIKDWMGYNTNIDYIKSIINDYKGNNIYSIIAYNYPAAAMNLLVKFCANNNIYFASDCTEWYGPAGNKFPINIIKNIDTYSRMRFANKNAKNVICISDYLEEFYLKKGCHTCNIPSLVDNLSEKWQQNTAEYIPNTLRTFAYVGSPGKSVEKDRLDWIIEAFYELKFSGNRFLFNIVGITKENYIKVFPEHEAMIKDLEDQVIFHGRLSHEKAIEFIKSSDYSIFARMVNRVTTAGFPTKLSESFACGIPVVTTPTSNISKYLINGKNGFLSDLCTANSLKETIKKAVLISDDELIKIHEFCRNNNTLDYRNFIEDIRLFMKELKCYINL